MKTYFLFTTTLFYLLAISCNTARRGETIVKPLQNRSEEVAHGQIVYMEYCHGCHPGGAAGLGPAINNKPLPGGLIKFQVRSGLGVMPAFDKNTITAEELDHLVAYLKVLRKNKEKHEEDKTATASNK